MAPTQLNNLDIDVGLLAALPVEARAARQIFDEVYQEEEIHNGNHLQIGISLSGYSFTVGRIGPHNVVLVYLPGMGKAKAASVGSIFPERFPHAKLLLLLGICGANPSNSEGNDIFLGDVIISAQVLVHDYGKWYQEGFQRLGGLSSSSHQILSFENRLKSCVQSLEDSAYTNLSLFAKKGMECFSRPESHHDRLFDMSYTHRHNQLPSQECSGCTKETACEIAKRMACEKLGCDAKEIIRDASHFPISLSPSLHFGPMASGDSVIKSGQHRDYIASETGAIAFEMESAGLMDIPHLLVIKGVSDYADSHKNDMWKGYAAAASASCAKAVIHLWVSERPGHTDSPPVRNKSSPVCRTRLPFHLMLT